MTQFKWKGTLVAVSFAVAMHARAQDAAPQPDATQAPPETLPTVPVQVSEPQEPVPASTEPDGATKLEDVVVTATKRKEASREVPISINAFRGDDLEKRGFKSLAQIVQFSPGVTLNSGENEDGNYLSIRGISADSRNNIYTRPTGLFLEDVSLTNPSVLSVLADVEPFDLQTVEVLKGPQGTLFGGSALSGAVRYVPNAPQLHVTQLKLSASGGRIADSESFEREYGGMVNVPVGSVMAIRGTGIYRKTPGWIDEPDNGRTDTNSSRRVQARGAVLLQPLDRLSIEASYFFRELHVAASQVETDVSASTRENSRHATPTDSRVKLYGLKGIWGFGFADLMVLANQLELKSTSVTDLTPSLALSSTPVVAYEPFVSSAKQPTGEVRLVSREPVWGIDYVIGLFYMHSDQHLALNTIVTTAAATALPDQLNPVFDAIRTLLNRPGFAFTEVSDTALIDALAIEKAAFVDLKRTFFDTVELDLGGRVYDQKTHGIDSAAEQGIILPDTSDAVPLPETVASVLAPIDTIQIDRGFNPKLALTWRPSRKLSVYASAVRGFRFGGINGVTGYESTALGIPLTFHSDHLWNYEVGVRTDWLKGRLIADVTGFYIDWKQPQILQLKQGILGYTDNVGAARSQGVEGRIAALLPWNFSADVNGAYVDSRTTEAFTSDKGDVGPGTRMPATPFVSASGVLSQRSSLAGFQFIGSYSLSYRGPSHNILQNDVPLPGFVLHNVSLNITRPDWKYRPEINFSVTNLFDKHVAVFGLTTPGAPIYVGNQPRAIRLTLSLNY
ncbi:MAG TPA: TonB-dependent receptor [Nevskiaceae bacterium]|nr:TonB-dependent receptor [Nevskiaceae bacterium]